jgi:plasmid stabilization system protein ParE
MRLAFTDAAEQELEALGDYVAFDNPAGALSFVRELRKDCALLATMPDRHPLLARYRASGIRRRVYGSYLIFYRVEGETVQILHILHGAMDYEAILFPES